jgi:phytoene synthase
MYSNLKDQLEVIEQVNTHINKNSDYELLSSYAHCMNIMKENSKSFYFASRTLPEDQRNSVAALYAFCRLVDDIVDESGKKQENINSILDALKSSISLFSTGVKTDHLILRAFIDTVQRYAIPVKYMHELIEGVRMDLTKKEYSTNQELDLYCYRVASTVGLMMVHIFMKNPTPAILARASDLGLAMQLTNILRDIKEDFGKGRVYLPLETRNTYNVTLSDIESDNMSENFKDLLKYEIERTKGIYKVAELGIKELPNEVQNTIMVSSKVYGDILNQIKRNKYQILTKRAVVSKKRKLLIALKIKMGYYIKFMM